MDTLDEVAQGDGLGHAMDERTGELEPGVVLQALQACRDDGDLRESGILEGLAQQGDVVRRPTHAAGLGEEQRDVVQVVPARLQRRDELPDDDDGGETGIVVDHGQPPFDVVVGRHLEHLDPVAARTQRRLGDGRLVGGQLGDEDGVGLAHLLGEPDRGGRHLMVHNRTIRLTGPLLGSGLQGTHPDACRTEVGDLVDLQRRVDAVAGSEDLPYLIGGDGVQPTTERVELDEFQVALAAHECRRLVEPGVEHPLVTHPQWTFQQIGSQMGHRVLGEHRHAQGVDHLGDAVMDLGIDVVGASGQHDAGHVVGTHVLQCLLAHPSNVCVEGLVLGGSSSNGAPGLLQGDPVGGEDLGETLGELVLIGQGQERRDELDTLLTQGVDIGPDDLGVGGDHRAVEMRIGLLHRDPLEADAWVEDPLDAALHEVLDVAIGELGGIADVLRGDRLHALVEHLMAGPPRDHHPIAQRGEHREPERVVLVHVERTGDAHVATVRLLGGESTVGEQSLVLGLEEVGQLRLGGSLEFAIVHLGTTFAAVPRHEDATVGEGGDGALAVVLAQHAVVAVGLHGETVELATVSQPHTGRFPGVEPGTCREGSSVGPHETGLGGTNHLPSGEQFEGTQHGVVEEGAPLHDDLVAELGRIGELDDLVQRIAHHGVAQSGGNVGGGGPLLLRLLDRGVHEHGAATAQIDRVLGVQAHRGETADVGVHTGGKGLQEGATPR